MKRNHYSSIALTPVALLLALGGLCANAADLNNMTFNALGGDRVEVRLSLTEPVGNVQSFTTDNPARISLDLPGVVPKVERKTLPIGAGYARSVSVAEAQGRTRVVLSLEQPVKYTTRMDGNDFVIMLGEGSGASLAALPAGADSKPKASGNGKGIRDIDFRRGEKGEARVVFNLADPKVGIDVRQEGRTVYADFMGTSIPDELIRRLDVVDFGTPAKIVDISRRGGTVQVKIDTTGEFDYLAYQADNQFTLELKPLTKQEVEDRRARQPTFTGERLSLNFQDIQVRAVLQLIADYTGINMVTSDTVGGSITLRLQNVPWDQALDIILKTKGLDKRQNGNVMLVAPADEIAARERLALESQKQQEELVQLRSEFIQINYAKAADIATLLKAKENILLSERGQVSVDERTNTLLVQDTPRKIDEVRQLIRTLDIPVRQVLIESRVVVANDDFTRELGVKFGVSDKNSQSGMSGNLTGAEGFRTAGSAAQSDRLNVNLPVEAAAGSLGFQIASLTDGTILDLELSALESEGKGEVISSPRVLTANQRESYIESGVEIPYLQASSAGNTNVTFRKAVLGLTVKPQITPDDNVILDLTVTKDSLGEDTVRGPAINTNRVGTQVLVRNGETVVLGGIFEEEMINNLRKVPFLGDLPGLGFLFRTKENSTNRQELIIFVTPKIIKDVETF